MSQVKQVHALECDNRLRGAQGEDRPNPLRPCARGPRRINRQVFRLGSLAIRLAFPLQPVAGFKQWLSEPNADAALIRIGPFTAARPRGSCNA